MSSSSSSRNNEEPKSTDSILSLESFLNFIQPNANLSDMINFNLSDENTGFTASFLNQRLGGTSSKHQHSTLNEINNSIETTDEYSSPSKSSPGSLIQQNTASFFDESKEDEDDTDAEKSVTKLFVGNLPFGTTLAELLPVFKKFGPVDEKLSAVKHRDHYAFINFYNRNDAQMALQEVNNSLFKDRYLRVQFSHSKQQFKSPSNREKEKYKSDNTDFQNKSFQYSQSESFDQSFPTSSFSSCLNESASSFIPSSSFHRCKNATNSPESKSACRSITANRLSQSHSFSFPSSTISGNQLSLKSLNQLRNSLIDKILLNEYNQSNFQREQILNEIGKLDLQIELATKQQQEASSNILSFNQRILHQQQQQLKHSQTQHQIGSHRLLQHQINRSFNPRKSSTMPKSSTIGNFTNNDQLCWILSQSKQGNFLNQSNSSSGSNAGKASLNPFSFDK